MMKCIKIDSKESIAILMSDFIRSVYHVGHTGCLVTTTNGRSKSERQFMLYHEKNVLEIIAPLSGLYNQKFWEIQICLSLCYDCTDNRGGGGTPI